MVGMNEDMLIKIVIKMIDNMPIIIYVGPAHNYIFKLEEVQHFNFGLSRFIICIGPKKRDFHTFHPRPEARLTNRNELKVPTSRQIYAKVNDL